jgi:hypothetical protein
VAELVVHVQQSKKKKTSPSCCAIIALFGATNPYKKANGHQ